MPPSILSSEALVIWMFRIAMNEPIMAASTAIQVVTLARFGSTTACVGGSRGREEGASGAAMLELDMLVNSGGLDGGAPCGRGNRHGMRFGRLVRGNGRHHRHARA